MCQPLLFLGLCSHAHVAFIWFRGNAAENILPSDSTSVICPIYRWLGGLPVFIFFVFYVANLADSQ